MCLFLEKGQDKMKVAEDDIVCWKILFLIGPEMFISPFYEWYYRTNTTHKDKARVQKTRLNPYSTMYTEKGCTASIDGGCFHTFKDKETTIAYKKWLIESSLSSKFASNDELVVVKCIIPKGTKYYEGLYDTSFAKEMYSYASKKLKITDEIYYNS